MLARGRRVGLGEPAELTAALAGRILEFEAEDPEKAIAVLRGWPETFSVTQLGSRVHLLLRPHAPRAAEAAPEVEELLAAAGLDDTVSRPAEPNLEDVFVALTAPGRRQDAGGGPAPAEPPPPEEPATGRRPEAPEEPA
jgi:ABC-2 type transport system ATP-binding protein